MRRGLLGLLIGAAGLAGCAVRLPHPSEADVVRAREMWPTESAESLEHGREVYVAKCSSCHRLHQPAERALPQWDVVLGKMAPRAHLTEPEREAIRRYLGTVRGEADAATGGR